MAQRKRSSVTVGPADPMMEARTERKSDTDVPEEEKQFVTELLGKIQRAIDLRKNFDEKTLPKLRRLMWGTSPQSETGEATTRANLIFATIATMLPHVYAKNPEIAVTPTEAVEAKEYEKWKAFCKTAQAFLNRVLIEEAGLKRRAKANVRSAMGTSIGWLKMTFQKNIVQDPLILQRQNDMQDNLQKIEKLIADADDPDKQNYEAKREELKQALASLQQSNEVKVFKGFAIDRVQTEDMFVIDENVVEFDDYVNAGMLAHRIWMSDETYERNFGAKPLTSAQSFSRPGIGDATDESGTRVSFSDNAKDAKFRAVFEVWDKSANRIYTVAMGQHAYCRPPYTPEAMPQRWYNFYGLAFNLVEGRFRPLADTELLQHLQEEYSETRYLYAQARKEAIPTRVFRKGGSLTEEDITKLANRKARQWIGIEGNPQVPLAQEFMQLDGVAVDAKAYDVTIIRDDMDMMVGLSDAARSNLVQAKTATEAEIMRQAMMNRVAERQDTNEDMITDMARSALEISLQKFTKYEVAEVVGEGAVWREDMTDTDGEPLSVEAIFHRISAAVRVGSTGRPNQMKEREQWTQLMPVINETMQAVAELRVQGMDDLAEAKIELLRETLRRFDERIDVDSLLPKNEQQMDQQGNPIPPAAQMMQKMQAMQQEVQVAQEAAQKAAAELQDCQRQLDMAKQAQAARIAEADANKAIEVARETAKESKAEADAFAKEQATLAVAQINAQVKRYEAKLDTAAKILTAQIQPTKNEDGSMSAAPEVGDVGSRIREIVDQLGEEDIPLPAMGYMPHRSDDSALLLQAIQAMQQTTQALAGYMMADKVVVMGANGLPERITVDKGPMLQ